MRVVTLESRIAVNARLKPESIAARSVLPTASSSLILSKIITFASTAIPIERTIPAMPGSERFTSKIDITTTISAV